jgi:hypothetical protein
MRAYSLNELFCLTRTELFALHAGIAAKLPTLCELDRDVAFNNLINIRRVLAQSKCCL